MTKVTGKAKKGVNSHCVGCGHDFFDTIVEKCPRCDGLCSQYTDHDMELMTRRQTRGEIVLPDHR